VSVAVVPVVVSVAVVPVVVSVVVLPVVVSGVVPVVVRSGVLARRGSDRLGYRARLVRLCCRLGFLSGGDFLLGVDDVLGLAADCLRFDIVFQTS